MARRFDRDTKLALYRIEADRLELIVEEGNYLLKALKTATLAAEVRTALIVMSKVLDADCPVCAFVKEEGYDVSGPFDKGCCPARNRCMDFVRIRSSFDDRRDRILMILRHKRNLPLGFQEYWTIQKFEQQVRALNHNLNVVNGLIRRMERIGRAR